MQVWHSAILAGERQKTKFFQLLLLLVWWIASVLACIWVCIEGMCDSWFLFRIIECPALSFMQFSMIHPSIWWVRWSRLHHAHCVKLCFRMLRKQFDIVGMCRHHASSFECHLAYTYTGAIWSMLSLIRYPHICIYTRYLPAIVAMGFMDKILATAMEAK
jgi:hypothetical protein